MENRADSAHRVDGVFNEGHVAFANRKDVSSFNLELCPTVVGMRALHLVARSILGRPNKGVHLHCVVQLIARNRNVVFAFLGLERHAKNSVVLLHSTWVTYLAL